MKEVHTLHEKLVNDDVLKIISQLFTIKLTSTIEANRQVKYAGITVRGSMFHSIWVRR